MQIIIYNYLLWSCLFLSAYGLRFRVYNLAIRYFLLTTNHPLSEWCYCSATFRYCFCDCSKWCMMDATTRRLARIPEEVQAEIVPCFIQDRFAFPQPKICPKIQRIDNDSAQYLSSHLKVLTLISHSSEHPATMWPFSNLTVGKWLSKVIDCAYWAVATCSFSIPMHMVG